MFVLVVVLYSVTSNKGLHLKHLSCSVGRYVRRKKSKKMEQKQSQPELF